MLTSIASARKGVRTTSIATDARFFVVLAFIRFVCSTSDAMRVASRRTGHLQPVCQWARCGFTGLVSCVCSLRLTTLVGPTGAVRIKFELLFRFLFVLLLVAQS